ncbi:MAG: asparaginase [Desulfobacula sp.]|jgi:L-asparaginase|nr:asparaginase [Desulfobacula sp.]
MDMNKIVVIATGGTIASKRNLKTQKMSSGVISGDKLLGLIPNLDPALPIEIQNLFGVPSSFLGPDKMLELALAIEKNLNQPDVKGVVVTHGTDTLEESVYLADLVTKNPKPVVFTGSQRGPLELGSDGIHNLRDAICVVSCDSSRDKGVLLVFNEEIHCAAQVTKTDAYKLETFRSEGKGPIGFIDENTVQYHSIPILSDHFPIRKINARVDLIKAVAGMDGHLVAAAVKDGASGIVIEGFGRGHVPPGALPAIQEAIEAGIIVLIVSRCFKGFVKEVYDFDGGTRDLLNKGAIAGIGLAGTKARIKLLVILSHTRDMIQIQSCFGADPSMGQRRTPC